MDSVQKPSSLPDVVDPILQEFVASARRHLGEQLKSVVLYGSAAENRLRPTSDVNLIVVLSSFEQARIDGLREPMRVAEAAIRLTVMFLLEKEVAAAAEMFAVKFADVQRRHRVLFGSDPFSALTISRQAEMARLRQVLFNLELRMRSTYMSRSLTEDQLALAIAEAAGPFRAAAAALLELKGERPDSPKEALERIAAGSRNGAETMVHLTTARKQRILPPGVAAKVAFELLELAGRMRAEVEAL